MRANFFHTLYTHKTLAGDAFTLSKEDLHTSENLIIPDGTPGILRIQKGKFTRKLNGDSSVFTEGDVIVFGQKTRSAEYCFGDDSFEASGIKLRPSALHTLFDIKANELTDSYAHINDISARHQDYMDATLTTELTHIGYREQVVQQMIQMIYLSKGLLNIKEACATLNQSYKSMQRLFHQYVGVPPKLFARMIRFNFSIVIGMTEGNNLTDTAYLSGYYDQNHFIKEVKSFTGMSPSEMLTGHMDTAHIGYLKDRFALR